MTDATETIHRPIPMLDLKTEVEELWDEINTAIHRVLRSGQFILGPEVEAFEEEVADYLGVKHAIGVNSGTDALVIGLRALGIKPGDEVITTPFTFFATVEAIVQVGAKAVLVDVDLETFNIDPEMIAVAVTERTKAIIPVHLFGNPAAMTRIRALAEAHGLLILEDAAQAFGATFTAPGVPAMHNRRVGALAHAAAFSFYPSKTLGAFGDAGLLVTDLDEVAASAKHLRNHAQAPGAAYAHTGVGYNSRLDSLQAAVLRVKLPHVDRWNAQRREAAQRYRALLATSAGIVVPAAPAGHVFHQFTVRVLNGRRDHVREVLSGRQVASRVFYPPLRAVPGVSAVAHPVPNVMRLGDEVLSLPLWPDIPPDYQARVAGILADT